MLRLDPRATSWGIVALVALACAYSVLLEPPGDNEKAHYALVRALASGKPYVDDAATARGRLSTIDVTRYHGRVYAAKAPGLAAASLPPYLVLKAVAPRRTTRDPRHSIWALHLWGAALPALLLLLLVRGRADAVAEGTGTAVAVTLGVATLVLPFATVFFSHVLATLLGFSAFVLLWRERAAPPRPTLVAAAGLVAGLGIAVDYSIALVAAVLLVYAAAREPRFHRLLAFAVGAAVGIAPILLFDTWAFGSPFHLAYEGWHAPGGRPLHTLFGLGAPSARIFVQLLISSGGVGPIVFPGLAAAVLLYRRFRAEALVIAAVTAAFLVFDSASAEPFGGASPGPRYLVPILPFVAVPLALALRSFAGATVGVALGSAAFVVGATATSPLAAWDHQVLHRLATGGYVDSVLSFAGVHGAIGTAPFFLAIAAAVLAAALASTGIALARRDVAAAALALASWLLLTARPARVLERSSGEAIALLVLALIAAAAVALVQGWRPHGRLGRRARTRATTT